MRAFAAMLLAGLGTAACTPQGAGFRIEPLQKELDPALMDGLAVELYLPPDSSSDLSLVVLDLMKQDQADSLRVCVPSLEGSLGETFTFVISETCRDIPLSSFICRLDESVLGALVDLEILDWTLVVEVFNYGAWMRTCFLKVHIPQRSLNLHFGLAKAEDGRPCVVRKSQPEVVGEPVATSLDADCPERPGSNLHSLVVQAVEEAFLTGAVELSAQLAQKIGLSVGMNSGESATLIRPSYDSGAIHASSMPKYEDMLAVGDTLRIGVGVAIESIRSPCVPENAPAPGFSPTPAATFPSTVPSTEMPYGMGVSISRDFLQQAWVAAYHGGLLCRYPFDDGPFSLQLVDLLPSTQALGELREVRLALWPGAQPEEIGMQFASERLGESLPRMVLILPRLRLDIYVEVAGTDVRLLGLQADTRLELIPHLLGANLGFRLARAEISQLVVEYSELLEESGSELNIASARLFERAVEILMENMLSMKVRRPAMAGELIGSELIDNRLLLYFRP